MSDGIDGFFWEVAEPFLAAGCERSTMMGFPCLRLDGVFFASVDHRSGELIVKLPAERVEDLIDVGTGRDFAPNGRRFRQWVVIPHEHRDAWEELMAQALEFAREP